MVARPMQLENDLLKQLMMWAIGCPHTLECMGNNTKQYEELASVDSTVLRPQLSPSVSVL